MFPERIDGKIAYVHRIDPAIQIDYFESIEEMLAPESWRDYGSRVDASTVLRGSGLCLPAGMVRTARATVRLLRPRATPARPSPGSASRGSSRSWAGIP